MTKRAKREPNGSRGFPDSWNIESCGNPSFGAYRSAMEFCQERSVDLHQPYTEGFAYEPQVLVGMPDMRIEVNEDADLLIQEGVTEKQTV